MLVLGLELLLRVVVSDDLVLLVYGSVQMQGCEDHYDSRRDDSQDLRAIITRLTLLLVP